MLSFTQAEAIRIAILSFQEKAFPDEDIRVAVNRRLKDDTVEVLITRSKLHS